MVSATFGFFRSAATLADFGTVAITICSPSHQNPIGIARGSPSSPVYAIRAGSGPLSNSCEYGLARIAVISSLVMIRILPREVVLSPGTEPATDPRHR